MTPFLKKLILSAIAAIATFLLLMFVLPGLLHVWWVDSVLGVAVAVVVWKYVSLSDLQKAAEAAGLHLGIK